MNSCSSPDKCLTVRWEAQLHKTWMVTKDKVVLGWTQLYGFRKTGGPFQTTKDSISAEARLLTPNLFNHWCLVRWDFSNQCKPRKFIATDGEFLPEPDKHTQHIKHRYTGNEARLRPLLSTGSWHSDTATTGTSTLQDYWNWWIEISVQMPKKLWWAPLQGEKMDLSYMRRLPEIISLQFSGLRQGHTWRRPKT